MTITALNILVSGIILVILIWFWAMLRNVRPKKKEPENLNFFRPEFLEEVKQEREHRRKQRKKYGIFDDNGRRL